MSGMFDTPPPINPEGNKTADTVGTLVSKRLSRLICHVFRLMIEPSSRSLFLADAQIDGFVDVNEPGVIIQRTTTISSALCPVPEDYSYGFGMQMGLFVTR